MKWYQTDVSTFKIRQKELLSCTFRQFPNRVELEARHYFYTNFKLIKFRRKFAKKKKKEETEGEKKTQNGG